MRYELTEQAIKNSRSIFEKIIPMFRELIKVLDEYKDKNPSKDLSISTASQEGIATVIIKILTNLKTKESFNSTDLNNDINYFEALFILLGLQIKSIDYLTFGKVLILASEKQINSIVLNEIMGSETAARLELRFYDKNKPIKKDEFLAWADDEGFLIKQGARVLDDNIAKQLHTLLTDNGFIIDSFDNKWQWRGQRNQLAYLAKQLKQKRLLNDNCHSELSMYIVETNESNRPLKNVPDPAIKKQEPINNIINEIT